MSKCTTFVEGFHDPEEIAKMKYKPLGKTGMNVSVLSLGSSAFGSCYAKCSQEDATKVLKTALLRGINLIDSAPWYGHGESETYLGHALQGIPREAYYIATKVCRYNPKPRDMFDFSYDRVIKSVDESLKRLQLDYIDVLQIHDPEFSPSLDIIVKETLPALEELRKRGKIRFIGITGYPLGAQKYIIDNCPKDVTIDTSLVYGHYSLNDSTLVSSGFLRMLEERGIGLISACPISMGLLSNQGPPAWHCATAEIKANCKEAAAYCASVGVDIATIAMWYSLHTCEEIPTTLCSTHSVDLLNKNIDVAIADKDTLLNDKERAALTHVMKTYFEPLKGRETWEGVEVQRFWAKLGQELVLEMKYNRQGKNYARTKYPVPFSATK